MVIKFLTYFILIFCFTLQAKSQHFSPTLSSGILYSKYISAEPVYKEGSIFRKGAWVSISQNIKLKNFLNLEGGLTYQERTPLEFFPFSTGTFGSGVGSEYIINGFPSNPQHKLFNTPNFTQRFSNFKYINLEIIPNILIGKKYYIVIGSGLFSGVLINKRATTLTHEDFSVFAAGLDQYGAEPEISYQKYDYGFVSKLSFGLKLSHKTKLGIVFKNYHSYAILNATSVIKWRKHNMRWSAFMGGLSLSYDFNQ